MELTSLALEKGEERVRLALVEGKIRRVADLPFAQEEELAAYAVARMIISSAANRYLINRYAIAEAKRAGEYLSIDDSSNPQNVLEIEREFEAEFERAENGFLVPLSPYLRYTPRSIDYKLTNRDVSGGKVRVNRHERIRMLEEAIRKKIESGLPIKSSFGKEIAEAGARILLLLPKLEATSVQIGQENRPPCIRKMLEDLALNINVPHTGRVALAIYLVNAGEKDEQIVEYFRHAPDFSEKTTQYQVAYIRAKGYRMPSCATMDSYGICVAECHCGSPLNFKAGTHGARLSRLALEKGE